MPSQSPNGASSPEGRAKSRLPLWGRCPPKEGGEGSVRPPSWHSAVRERRGKAPVSLASLWLTPIKVKTVGRCPFSPAASGAVCQWQTSRTDRRGSGDWLLGNVPLGRNSPFSKGPASAAVCPQAGFIFPASCAHPAGGRGWRCPPYRRWPSRPPASYNRWASSRPRCTRPCTPG